MTSQGDIGSDDTPPPPDATPAPAIARRGLRWWWIVGAVVVVAAAGTVTGLALSGEGGSPDNKRPTAASRFDRADQAFHARFGPESAALTRDMARAAGDGIGGTAFFAATRDAMALAATLRQYEDAVKAIDMPPAARESTASLVRIVDADVLVMDQANKFFTAAGFQSLLDSTWREGKDLLPVAENAVRSALNPR